LQIFNQRKVLSNFEAKSMGLAVVWTVQLPILTPPTCTPPNLHTW